LSWRIIKEIEDELVQISFDLYMVYVVFPLPVSIVVK